jgi:hypothetical protein
MKQGPWTSGPRELLDHAKDHLGKKTDVDNRFAMISVDNAVELMLKTYITLPKRVTGLHLTRREKDECTRYFATALSKVEELEPGRVSSVPLGEIEWFHRIRNQLYHEGNAITVERDKVERYLKHAEGLMRSLFPDSPPDASPRMRRYQEFFETLRREILRIEPNFTRAKARQQHWWTVGVGRTGFYLEPWFTAEHTLRITISIGMETKQQNDAAFEQLLRSRAVIEEQLGEELVWDPLPESRTCRIYAAVDGTIDDDQEHLDQLIEWAAPTVIRFREVFQPLVRKLDLRT